MGRREQKERERKRATVSCQMLERFLSKKVENRRGFSELNDSSVQNEMQPSLQTIPVTDTSAPSTSTSQESVCNDCGVCQHQETSKSLGLQAKITGRVTLLPETTLRLLRIGYLVIKGRPDSKTGK